MVRLYLLGFTHDLKGVVFSQRKNGKSAAFWVPIDKAFLEAVDKLESARSEASGGKKGGKGKAKPVKGGRPRSVAVEEERRPLPPVGRSQSTSRLPVSEIQQLLREGRSVKTVVDASKAPQAWIERLNDAVLTERIGVVRLTQRASMYRPRLGRSGLPVGDAVLRNLEERRATADTIEGIDDAWDARATRSGTWKVWVKFGHRGKRRTAEWEFRKSTRQVLPRNRLAAQLGWWPPEPGAEPERIEGLEEPGLDGAKPEEGTAPKRRKPKRAAKRRPKRKPARKATSSRSRTAKRPPAKRSRGKARPRRKPARRR